MTDSYFTDARRRDPKAFQFEPYRGHRIEPGVAISGSLWTTVTADRLYKAATHSEWRDTPAEVRAEVDACLDETPHKGCLPGETHYLAPEDPFERFER